jgi:uncharacterized protein (DUF302 family)
MVDQGLVNVPSAHGMDETVQRLLSAIEGAGMTVFAQIDHAAGAATVGMELRPTRLVIFGSPKGGTPLMLDQQPAGIDLPLKALVWQDADEQVWLSYNDARWIADRHGLSSDTDAAVATMNAAVEHLASRATD